MDAQAGEIVAEQLASAEAFLLGRGTYEIFAGYWPRVSDPDDLIAAWIGLLLPDRPLPGEISRRPLVR
jgi:dihydrofolate reductase